MTYNIEAFGHQKLIFIPQHLKKVQMSGDKKMHQNLTQKAIQNPGMFHILPVLFCICWFHDKIYPRKGYLSRVSLSWEYSLSMTG